MRAERNRLEEIAQIKRHKQEIERLKQLKVRERKEREEQQLKKEVKKNNSAEYNPLMTRDQLRGLEVTKRLMEMRALNDMDKESYAFCQDTLEDLVMSAVDRQIGQIEASKYCQQLEHDNFAEAKQNKAQAVQSRLQQQKMRSELNQRASLAQVEHERLQNQLNITTAKANALLMKLVAMSTTYEVGLYNRLEQSAPWAEKVQRLEENIQDLLRQAKESEVRVRAKKARLAALKDEFRTKNLEHAQLQKTRDMFGQDEYTI